MDVRNGRRRIEVIYRKRKLLEAPPELTAGAVGLKSVPGTKPSRAGTRRYATHVASMPVTIQAPAKPVGYIPLKSKKSIKRHAPVTTVGLLYACVRRDYKSNDT